MDGPLLALHVFLAGKATALLFFVQTPNEVYRWSSTKKLLLGSFMVGSWWSELALSFYLHGFSSTVLYYLIRGVLVAVARRQSGHGPYQNGLSRDIPEMWVVPLVFPGVVWKGVVELSTPLIRKLKL